MFDRRSYTFCTLASPPRPPKGLTSLSLRSRDGKKKLDDFIPNV